ncbi:MAG: polymer-forming cytoskeletal protein [Desulfuromonadaceae bacterium]|nr:polymer-forming cytoskeletal protein [Desulfuromonadaceae bacterium]
MFSSSSKTNGSTAISTILGEGTQLTGEMTFKGTMRIDGQFDGNLSGEHLVISASGKVIGDVVAISCLCHGEIQGNLTVDRLELKQGGRIDGTISADDLVVESGALMMGEVRPKKKELRLLKEDADPSEQSKRKTS